MKKTLIYCAFLLAVPALSVAADVNIGAKEMADALKQARLPTDAALNQKIEEKRLEIQRTLDAAKPAPVTVPNVAAKPSVPGVVANPTTIRGATPVPAPWDQSGFGQSIADMSKTALVQGGPQVKLSVFASTSMPLQVIKRLADEAVQINATLTFRGTPENMMTPAAIYQYLRRAGVRVSPEIQVHPDAFKAYEVAAVPAFVMAMPDAELRSDPNGCALPSTFAKVSGDISIRAALELFEQKADAELADAAKEIIATKYAHVR